MNVQHHLHHQAPPLQLQQSVQERFFPNPITLPTTSSSLIGAATGGGSVLTFASASTTPAQNSVAARTATTSVIAHASQPHYNNRQQSSVINTFPSSTNSVSLGSHGSLGRLNLSTTGNNNSNGPHILYTSTVPSAPDKSRTSTSSAASSKNAVVTQGLGVNSIRQLGIGTNITNFAAIAPFPNVVTTSDNLINTDQRKSSKAGQCFMLGSLDDEDDLVPPARNSSSRKNKDSSNNSSNQLSALHAFARRTCIEVFAASTEDQAKYTRSKESKRARLGQVGLRCVFCKHLPGKLVANQATSFPTSINNLYESTRNWHRFHMPRCKHIPKDVRLKYDELKRVDNKKNRFATKDYFVNSAKKLGMIDTPVGIFFAEDRAAVSNAFNTAAATGIYVNPLNNSSCSSNKNSGKLKGSNETGNGNNPNGPTNNIPYDNLNSHSHAHHSQQQQHPFRSYAAPAMMINNRKSAAAISNPNSNNSGLNHNGNMLSNTNNSNPHSNLLHSRTTSTGSTHATAGVTLPPNTLHAEMERMVSYVMDREISAQSQNSSINSQVLVPLSERAYVSDFVWLLFNQLELCQPLKEEVSNHDNLMPSSSMDLMVMKEEEDDKKKIRKRITEDDNVNDKTMKKRKRSDVVAPVASARKKNIHMLGLQCKHCGLSQRAALMGTFDPNFKDVIDNHQNTVNNGKLSTAPLARAGKAAAAASSTSATRHNYKTDRHGKYFPNSLKKLSDASFSSCVFLHMLKCENCPREIKSSLDHLNRIKGVMKRQTVKRGSKKIFFSHVWARLCQNMPQQQLDEEQRSSSPNQENVNKKVEPEGSNTENSYVHKEGAKVEGEYKVNQRGKHESQDEENSVGKKHVNDALNGDDSLKAKEENDAKLILSFSKNA